MKNRCTRRWTTFIRKTIIAIFTVVFSTSLALASNASAVTNIFKIEDVKLDRLSETTEGEIINFDDSNITTSAVFHQVGDAVKYTLTLKNSDEEDRSIKSITDNNTNAYISYEYDSYENTVVKAGETFDFVVTARYINSISSFDERTQTPNVKFAIDYLNNDYYNNNDNGNGNGSNNGNYYYTEVEEIVLVPNTGRNTAGVTSSAVKNNVYVLLGFAVGLTIYIVIVAKKHNKNPKIILCMLVLIAAATVTTSIRALSTETNTISFSENYSLLDKVAVTYVVDGNRETEAVQYGNKINKENPKKAGNTFSGWVLEDGTSFDTETLLTKDTVLIAKFVPSSFALNFNANGLNFANNTDSNLIEHKRSCHEEAVTTIAHTSNLNDDGTYKEEGEGGGDMGYPNYAAEKTVISVPGATKLKVTINYGIEEGYDALFVFAGNYNGSDPTSSDDNYGQIATLSSGYDNVLTRTLDVDDGTVTFFFHSDSSERYYGYFATIEGYDSNNDPIGNTVTVCENEIISGEYLEPETDDAQVFYGWSFNQSATQADYKTFKEVAAAAQGELGETVNVYAIWEERETFAIKMHGNGLKFDNNSELNTTKYTSVCREEPVVLKKYSHTGNINNDGVRNDNESYADNLNTKDVITFENASSLRVTTTYATESGWDYVYIFSGNYEDEIHESMHNYAGQIATYDGSENYPTTTVTDIVLGNTVTIAFYSDGSNGDYGYYSVVEPLDADGNIMTSDETVTVCERERVAGLYREPVTVEGQVFIGWAESPDASAPEYLNETEITANLPGRDGESKDLYAIWFNIHTIHFDGNGSDGYYSLMNDQKIDGGHQEELTANTFYRSHYTFLGWSTNKDATEPEYTNRALFTAPDAPGAITLYAVWQKNHRVIYDGNGATSGSMSDSYFTPGSMAILYSNRFSRNNYDFLGWSEDQNAVIPTYANNQSFTVPDNSGETTLYAIWIKKFRVIYDGNGATSGSTSDSYHTRGTSSYLSRSNYTRTDYRFVGWSTDKDATTPAYADGGNFTVPTNSDGMTLYAIWAKQHRIIYNGNGATSGSMGDNVVAAGGTVTLQNNNYTRTNYVFTGWSEDKDATIPTYLNQASFTAPTDTTETTLYAVWRKKPVVHFDGNGNTSGTMVDQVFEFNTAALLTSNRFSRTYYSFLGWSEDKNATSPTYQDRASFTPPTDRDEVTLYAVWKKMFIIHYDINGGESGTMADQYIDWNNTSSTLNCNQFVRMRYYVEGWNTDKNANEPLYEDCGAFQLPTDGTEEITLYAIWKPAYTIFYDGGDGVEGGMIYHNVTTGDVIGPAYTSIKRVGSDGYLIAPNYSKAGYGFAGWAEDPDAASKINNILNPPVIYGQNEKITLSSRLANTATEEGDITLHAVWIPAETEYTLQTFDKTAFEAAYPNKKVIALRDERDNNVYAVSKIAGGYWWMMENLRLDFSNPNTSVTAANTNNPSSTFLSRIRSFKGRTDYQNFFNTCEKQNAACYDIVSFSTNNINRNYASVYGGDSILDERKIPSSWYSYGVMYNWYTAVAGNESNYSGPSHDGTTIITSPGDICPSGWKLPTGGINGDFDNINVALGGTRAQFLGSSIEWYASNYVSGRGEGHAWYQYPVNATKAGTFTENGVGSLGKSTMLYTSTRNASGGLGSFFQEYYYRGREENRANIVGYREIWNNGGFAVRCIAK